MSRNHAGTPKTNVTKSCRWSLFQSTSEPFLVQLLNMDPDKAARELAPAQFAIGVSGGSEAMVHACTFDATENPELALTSPDVKKCLPRGR